MPAEKPDGEGGVPAEMEPKLGSFAGKTADGEGLVKVKTETMGLGWYAGVDRTKGVIQGLFVENVRECSGSDELVAFTKQAIDIVGNTTERLTVLGALGRGKCGKVDEVQLVDFPGGSYALKTICEVRRARMKCVGGNVYYCCFLAQLYFVCDDKRGLVAPLKYLDLTKSH